MSPVEILVVLGGLAAGWFIVTLLMSSPSRLPVVDDRVRPWHEVLAVEPGASGEAIEAAYRRHVAALEQHGLHILTVPEQQRIDRRRAALETARREGLASAVSPAARGG